MSGSSLSLASHYPPSAPIRDTVLLWEPWGLLEQWCLEEVRQTSAPSQWEPCPHSLASLIIRIPCAGPCSRLAFLLPQDSIYLRSPGPGREKLQEWVIGTSWLLKDSRQAVGSMESRTLYSVWLWTQVLIVLSGWGWAQPVDHKDIGYCAKHNCSPLASSSDWGSTAQSLRTRHALRECERERKAQESYSNLERKNMYKSNLF